MRPPTRAAARILCWAWAALLLAGCQSDTEWVIQGRAMGTSYSVRVPRPPTGVDRASVEALAAREIEQVEALMSTYRPESELSRFNDSASADWVSVSPLTAEVVQAAQDISLRSGGAFDVTVGPLVELWGFGARPSTLQRPDPGALEQARQAVGYQQLAVRHDPPALKKTHPVVRVDLSAIAKGYASDRVCAALSGLGVTDYMVEIGGDLRVAGNNREGQPWRIAVETPTPGEQSMLHVLRLSDIAIATSGDYRNFFVQDGVMYSHTIDPRTASPVTHQVASVSVRAPTAMLADGWATALMVMGPEQGMALADELGLAALMVLREGDAFREIPSRAW